MPQAQTLSKTAIDDLELVHRGKVRDVYEVSDTTLLLVATDRISAFDCVLPTPIPSKGKVLTQLSAFWFRRLENISVNHLLTSDFEAMPTEIRKHEELSGRSMLVRKTKVFPVECVVRGYLSGSGWKDYKKTGEVCGHKLPSGLREADRLPEILFTPATKAHSGHDENISEMKFAEILGAKTATRLKTISLALYKEVYDYALTRGIIVADTKFEFGLDQNENILLIDEALTPDSSRFWSAANYAPGKSQASFDKQFVRDYLESLDWNKQPPAPELPEEIVSSTTNRYLKAFETITGAKLNV